jgi:hypothetical protein
LEKTLKPLFKLVGDKINIVVLLDFFATLFPKLRKLIPSLQPEA